MLTAQVIRQLGIGGTALDRFGERVARRAVLTLERCFLSGTDQSPRLGVIVGGGGRRRDWCDQCSASLRRGRRQRAFGRELRVTELRTCYRQARGNYTALEELTGVRQVVQGLILIEPDITKAPLGMVNRSVLVPC